MIFVGGRRESSEGGEGVEGVAGAAGGEGGAAGVNLPTGIYLGPTKYLFSVLPTQVRW